MNNILFILSGIIIGYLLLRLRQFIINSGIEKIKEKYDIKKQLEGLISVGRGELWGKTITTEWSIRTLIVRWIPIILIVLSCIYFYGKYQGRISQPIKIIGAEELIGQLIPLDGNKGFIEFTEKGTIKVIDIDKKTILKTITVKDVPKMRKILKPYGIDIQPFFTAGFGAGEKHTGKEFGIGSQFFKYFKWHVDGFLTNRGIYLGVDYQLTDNFGLLGGYGKGWNGDNRGYFGGMFKF